MLNETKNENHRQLSTVILKCFGILEVYAGIQVVSMGLRDSAGRVIDLNEITKSVRMTSILLRNGK